MTDERLYELIEELRPLMTGMMLQALSRTDDDSLMRLEILTPNGHAIKFKAERWKKICSIIQQCEGIVYADS